MFKHSSLLDRSHNTLAQLANIRRMHRVKAGVNNHLDNMEDLVGEFGSLPLCLRDEYLVRAIDNALDNSLALHLRVKAWTFEEGEIVEVDVVKGTEDYLKKCVEVVDDIREAIRGLRALVPEEKEEEDGEEDGDMADEQAGEQAGEQADEQAGEQREGIEQTEDEEMYEHENEEEEDV